MHTDRFIADSLPSIQLPFAPVSGAPGMMSERNDKNVCVALTHYDAVRESPQNEALGASLSSPSGQGCQRNDILLEQIEGRLQSALKLGT